MDRICGHDIMDLPVVAGFPNTKSKKKVKEIACLFSPPAPNI
jgi:hypothetical protein